MIPNAESDKGEAQKRGIEYEVAEGTLIPNIGDKKFVAVNEGGVERKHAIR